MKSMIQKAVLVVAIAAIVAIAVPAHAALSNTLDQTIGYISGTTTDMVRCSYIAEMDRYAIFFYFRDTSYNLTGARILFDDGTVAEVLLPNGDDTIVVPQKVSFIDGSVIWALYDITYAGSEHQNIIIEKTSYGDWNAYSFTPDTENPAALLDRSTWESGYLGGAILDGITLPEAGTWPGNGISVEYPSFETLYYSSGRVQMEYRDGAEPGTHVIYYYLDEEFFSPTQGRMSWGYNLTDGYTWRMEYFAADTELVQSYQSYRPAGDLWQQYEYYHEQWNSDDKGIMSSGITSGRVYHYVAKEGGVVTRDTAFYAYGMRSAAYLIERGLVSPSLGYGTTYYYYDETLANLVAGHIEFDDATGSAEFTLDPSGNEGENVRLTKISDYVGDGGYDTSWFLWGDNVYGEYDNVVIDKPAWGDWAVYTFVPNMANPEAVADRNTWTFIGTIEDPSGIVLPELGDWWQWCFDHYIVPEFVATASEWYDSDDDGRLDGRLDTNDYLNSSYIFYWDEPAEGLVQAAVQYDYDGDEDAEFVYARIYDYNGIADPEYFDAWTYLYELNYDQYTRLVRQHFADDSVYKWIYWGGEESGLRYYGEFGPAYAWQQTIEYYEETGTIHYQWFVDANPLATGDEVLTIYDTVGRVTEKRFDDTSFNQYYYWGETSWYIRYYAEFGPDYTWKNTTEYYEGTGIMHYQWVADKNPTASGDAVLYIYDTQGRMTEKRFDDTSFNQYYYWDETGYDVRYYAEFGPNYSWQQTIEYYEDGTSVHYKWLADQNPEAEGDIILEEYDTDGNLYMQLDDAGNYYFPGSYIGGGIILPPGSGTITIGGSTMLLTDSTAPGAGGSSITVTGSVISGLQPAVVQLGAIDPDVVGQLTVKEEQVQQNASLTVTQTSEMAEQPVTAALLAH